jgi:hypothetical protein
MVGDLGLLSLFEGLDPTPAFELGEYERLEFIGNRFAEVL